METVFTVSLVPNTTDVFVAVKSDAEAGVPPAVHCSPVLPKSVAMHVLTSSVVGTSVVTEIVRAVSVRLPNALLSVRVTMMFSPS